MRLLSHLFETRVMSMDADPGRLHDVRSWAAHAAAEAGLGESECFQVRLAISEAVTNAIQHGSGSSSDTIWIEAFERDGSLVFEVRDSGTFVAPLARADDDAESGRGLEVLAVIMDEVHISTAAGGSVLRFAKRLA